VTLATVSISNCTDRSLRPMRMGRMPLCGGEVHVARWLRECNFEAEHERFFYPFWHDATERPHGFRLDFTLFVAGIFLGIEVCEAGRYPTKASLPPGSNTRKWRPPEAKLRDKRDKIARLAVVHGVPCALVTEVEIDAWARLSVTARTIAIESHLQAVLDRFNKPSAA
jgi:hypothetical protein